MFFIFGKLRKKLIYFWIPRQNSSMEGDEVGIFSKVPDWKPLFLLKIKTKQNPGCPNKDIFKHIIQNIKAYPKSKKSALINDYENIVAYSEQFEQSEAVGEQVRFVLNIFWGSEGWCHPRKMWLFLLSCNKLWNSIPSTQTDTKLLQTYLFLENWQFNLSELGTIWKYSLGLC